MGSAKPQISNIDDGQEREPRNSRLFVLTISSARFERTRATIRNISKHGLGGRTKAPLLAGEEVMLMAEDIGHQIARVCWVNGENFGLYVTEEIDIAQFKFADRNWDEKVIKPLGRGHVFKRFVPVTSTKRPGFRKASK